MGTNKFDPAVCAGLVVWTDMRNGNPDIYGRDLAGGQEFPSAATSAIEAYPDCDGSRVVYMSTGAVTGVDISMFDRTTGATTTVSAQPWNEWMPAISGNRVVWQGGPVRVSPAPPSRSSAPTSTPALRSPWLADPAIS
jgi:beta propeller repeat protein